MKTAALVLFLLLPAGLFANPVADLRASLERFRGQEPVRGRVEIQIWNRTGEGKKARERAGSGQMQVEDGPQGLRLGWTAPQMQAARQDALARAGNPEAAAPNLDCLKAVDAAEASRMLNFADYLEVLLQGAQVLEDRPEPYQGRPARLLVLKPEAHVSAEERDLIKSLEIRLKVWLGVDGVPLGLEESVAFTGSKFFLTFHGGHSESTTLARVGRRLVALRCTRESNASGMGLSTQGRVVANLVLAGL
jgi:hypothetical protein